VCENYFFVLIIEENLREPMETGGRMKKVHGIGGEESPIEASGCCIGETCTKSLSLLFS